MRGACFSDLAPAWRTALLRTYVSVVLIQDANLDEIEELLAKLDSGVPLADGSHPERR